MSLISFCQQSGSLSGVSIYDAPPEWELSEPSQSDELIYSSLETDEGSGAWLVFNQSDALWGTILRSGDSPYNDCLPPSETFLLEAFQSGTTPETILEELYDRTDDQFLNPFLAVIGDLHTNELFWFTGSFQSDHGKLETGSHFLRDNASPNVTSAPEALAVGNHPDNETLKQQLQNGLEKGIVRDALASDGMRSPEYVTLFSQTPGDLQLQYSAEFPPGAQWEALSRSSTVTG